MNGIQRIFYRPFFIRLFNWEYWSFAAVYGLIYPVYFLLALRARSFFFFAAANPRIKNGGFLNESKKDIAPLIPESLHPRTVFFAQPFNADFVMNELQTKGLMFPLIGKPDVGGRGRGVKALRNEADVRHYVQSSTMDFHIQEFVAYKNEVGIFYHRLPGETKGRITGIVRKEFLSVTGDGVHTIHQLLQMSKRGLMYLPALEAIHREGLNQVLPGGEKFIVSPYGNHARGALFLDDSDKIDQTLTESFDRICQEIPEFYYGRLDIRYDNWEDLRHGRKLAIIEVNGAGAEPTHMYDPRHSIFFAWKEIIRHWFILWKVSTLNHRRGHRYLTLKEGIEMFREDKEWSRKLATMPG